MNKELKYQELLSLAKALIDTNVDDIANMANISRLIMDSIPNHWVGFYRVVHNSLVLGPFNGPIACTVIEYGDGVCGTAWASKQTQVVADVHQFPGHIACSSATNSEIVVPCFRDGEVFAVLDIDSDSFNSFDKIDSKYLEELVSYL